MPQNERYFIGPGLRDKLRDVITRVGGMPDNVSGANVPTRLQDMSRGMRLQRGTFTGSWNVGETKQVTIHGSTSTTSVTNYCVGVTQGTSTTAALNVVFCNVMGTSTAVEIQPDQNTSTCVMTLAGFDLSGLPGYSAGVVQLIGHTAADISTNATACATLTWYSVTTCTGGTAA